MNPLIRQHWQRGKYELPGINCIVYPEGKVTILRHTYMYDPNTDKRKIFCFPLCDTTIENLEKHDTAYWTGVGEWASIDYQGGKICAGDGGMGNEGALACMDAKGDLLWGIFFENTNPLKSLEIRDDILIIINEHDELRLEINLKNINEIKIEVLKQ